MSDELTEIDEASVPPHEEESTTRDPILDWFLTH